MSYKNKKKFKLLLFLTLCTVMFSTESSKKTEKVNSEELVRYHEIIHHINSFKNNPNIPTEQKIEQEHGLPKRELYEGDWIKDDYIMPYN